MNKSQKLKYNGLLLWGVISAIIIIMPYLLTVGNGWVPKFRCERLEECAEIYRKLGKFDFSHQSHTLGYVLYFPVIMSNLNILSGYNMFSIAQSIAGGIVLIVYPVLMYRLFESLKIAVLSPVLIHFTIGDLLYINKSSEYWSGCWSLVIGVPLLLLFIKERESKKRYIIVLALALIMGIANILRGQSALPLLLTFITLLVVLLMEKKISLKKCIFMFLICMCFYNLMGRTIPDIVAHQWGYEGKTAYNSSPWHSMLIGMGYIENNYGLYYSDDSAKEIIERIDPNITYNSNEYYDACKEEALRIIKENPAFFIKGIILKAKKCIQLQLDYVWGISPLTYYWHPYILIMIIILVNIIIIIKTKRVKTYVRKWGGVSLGAEAALFSLYAGIMVYPSEYYIMGGFGGIGTFLLQVCFSMITFNIRAE